MADLNSTRDTFTMTSPPAVEERMCLKVFISAIVSSYSFLGFILACSMGHCLVLVVCWRERKKATYKQDIVYMVGLALVDIAVCLLVPVVVSPFPHILNSEVFKSVFLSFVILSLNLLTTRALERFKMVFFHKMRPWSFKVQLKVSLMFNVTTVSLFSIIYYLDDFPIVALYMGVCSLIIVTAYTIIFGKLVTKYHKVTSQVVPSDVNDSKNKPSHESERETKIGKAIGVDAPNASTSVLSQNITGVDTSQASTSAMPTDLTTITAINIPQAPTRAIPPDLINVQLLRVPKVTHRVAVGYESSAVKIPSNVTGTAGTENSELKNTAQKTTIIVENKPGSTKVQKNTCSETAIRDGQNPRTNMQTRKKNVVIHIGLGLLLVTVVFYISWIPVLLAKFTDWVPCEVMMVAALNYTTNPLIYFLTLNNFREAIVRLIVPKCCKSYANR